MSNLSLKNISKSYGNEKILKNINLEIESSEFLVLVGPSGCGKSTTLRLIAGLENPTEGEIYIDDVIVNDIDPSKRDIAMVFQNYALYPQMTVKENMAFGLKIRKCSRQEIDIRVKEAAEILKIDDLLERRPKELSGDKSPMMEAIWDALKWLEQNKNLTPNAVLLLQPTSPLRKEEDIINAIKQVENEEDFSIVSVTRMREHPFECIETNENGWSFLSKPDNKSPGRQGYNDNFFFIDGSFYFASIGFLIKNKTFLIEDKTQFHILNQLWPIDIDDQEDLAVAEFFLR